MSLTRAQHRDKAEELMARYDDVYVEDPEKLLLAAVAHSVLSLGADEAGLRLDPLPAGLPHPRH